MSRDLPMSFDATGPEAGEDEAGGPRVGLRLARAGAGSLTVDGYNSITDAAAVAESQETGRLVYVAASRARERLILSGIYKAKEADGEERDAAASHSTIRRLLPALGIVDDGESEGFDVELPAPEPREDLEAEFGPARLRVRFSRVSDPGAAALAYDLREAAPEVGPAPGGTPPLTVLSERGASAARSLSYAALAEYSRCGYRFLTERVLALGAHGAASAPGPGSGAEDEGRARLGFGRAVHELLEAAALAGWRHPDPGSVEAALVRQGAEPGRVGEATDLLERWLASELLGGLREEGAKLRPELGFRLDLGGGTLLRGTIDLLAESPDGADGVPTVIDYKTDRSLPAGGSLPPAYEIQRDLYACAIATARGAEAVRTAYVFLRSPDEPIVETLDADAIAAGRERIGGLVERIREGDFAPTPLPHRALCHDCPARMRLCPHPPEVTGSELATLVEEVP
jgi:ATP-dependent exoDNAse (exonuclease V) beta subunit